MRTFLIGLLIAVALYSLYGLLVYCFQKKLIFQTAPLPQNYIFTFDNVGQQCRELHLEAHDGVNLNALLFRADEPRGLVLFCHGNGGNIAEWGALAETYVNRQYHFLVWDYREFGKTKGKLTYQNMLKDAETVYAYAKEYSDGLPVIPYGVSLGTALATHIGQKYQVAKVVLETPFYTMQRLAREHFPGLPYGLLLQFPFDNHAHLKHYNGAVFMIHGTEDRIIPYSHAQALESAFPEKIHLTTVDGSGHNYLAFYQAYRDWHNEALKVEAQESPDR